jgi:hypothetical protein
MTGEEATVIRRWLEISADREVSPKKARVDARSLLYLIQSAAASFGGRSLHVTRHVQPLLLSLTQTP